MARALCLLVAVVASVRGHEHGATADAAIAAAGHMRGARARPTAGSGALHLDEATLHPHVADFARELEAVLDPEHSHGHGHHGAVHSPGGGCGYGHPFADAHFGSDDDAVETPVEYHTLGHEDVRRALHEAVSEAGRGEGGAPAEARRQLQAMYNTKDEDGTTFLPLASAEVLGLARGIRIAVVWDPIEGSDFSGSLSGSKALQCTRVSGTITVPCESGASGCTQTWGGCTADDVIGPASVSAEAAAKLAVMKKRLTFAAEYFNKALKVKPVLTDLTVHPSIVSAFGLKTSTFPKTDLVIIMTARPSPWVALNGFASCRQRDLHGRCVVGAFNWVPRVLDVAGTDALTVTGAERHTALHEIIHVLGGMNPNKVFIDSKGQNKKTGVYINAVDGPGFPKPAMKLVTPKVLAMVRKHFNCPTMDGMPLEDQPTGRAAHWEARVMGPEVMSYGTGTGETYMSDLTFAFLEDTNQYIANYSRAGLLVEPEGDTGQQASFKIDVLPPPDYAPPVVHTPGELRWGRGEGCGFVGQKPTTWPDRYACAKNREFACSYDNRMASVCAIRGTWALPTNKEFTCGTCPEGQFTCATPSCRETPNDSCDAANGCRLPSMLQYFDATNVAAAVGNPSADPQRAGGFSSAMDFAPVRLSYWSCQNAQPSTNGSKTLEAEAGGSTGLGALTNGAEENMRLFGGQAYCPTCRCFVSSLMDFSSGSINPDFPRFGLCYRSNCYKEDYLQFAIEGQLGSTTWYKCPRDGGKIYIAGFAGAFHCPKAVEFCKFEKITGVKYKETNPLWEWIFYATLGGFPTLIVLCCAFIPPCRRWAIGRGKKWCGVNHFNRRGDVDDDAEVDWDEKYEKPPKVPSTVLLGTNVATLMMGLAMLGTAVYAIVNDRVSEAGPLIIAVSCTTIAFASVGAYGAVHESRGISCVIVCFFYVTFGSFLLFIFMVVFSLLFPDSLNDFLVAKWDVLVDATPKNAIPEEIDPDGGAIRLLEDNMAVLASVLVAMFLVFIVNLVMSVWIITRPVLASTMMTIASYAFIFTGACVVAAGGYVTAFHSGLNADMNTIVAVFVCFGLYVIAANILALVGAFTKERSILLASLLCESLTLVLFCVGGALLFGAATDLDATVNALDDDQLQSLTQNMGLVGLSRQQVADRLRDNVRTFGTMCLVILIMLVCQVISNAYFLHRVRKHVKRMNSVKLQVVPYTHHKNQLDENGQPLFATGGGSRSKDVGRDSRRHGRESSRRHGGSGHHGGKGGGHHTHHGGTGRHGRQGRRHERGHGGGGGHEMV